MGRGFWSREAAKSARRNLQAVDSLDDHADRDFVIEAVFEDAEMKRGVFGRLDALLRPEAGLASNTSSISITSLSSALNPDRRRRFLGTHFFSPVSRMRLVEVIPTLDSDPDFIDRVSETLVGIGKTPIRVKDVVGFAVNRLLHALVLKFDPTGRRRRLFARRYRRSLQARARPSDWTVRASRQHREFAVAERP